MQNAWLMLATIIVTAPLSIVGTWLLLPLWRWLEAATGIEAIGHSGPSQWCYVAVFLVMLAAAASGMLLRRTAWSSNGQSHND